MQLMQGFPPNEEQQVTLANWRKPPFNRWAFNHVSELVPSASIRAAAQTKPLPRRQSDDLKAFAVEVSGQKFGLEAWLEKTYTDSMVILKNGELVFEYYGEGQSPEMPHIWMSVSKSVLGLVAGILIDRGELAESAPVVDLVPEVAGSAFDGATVRDLLDMRVGIKFDEDYHAVDGSIIAYRKAHLWDPVPVGEPATDMRSFFSTLKARDGQHNTRFHYVSPNTDLLGWILERASGIRYADLVSELLWQPIGAERDAYITVDRLGAPRCAGGLCASPIDMARLTRLFVTEGAVNGRQVVPASWLHDIVHNGDAAAWKEGDFFELFDGADMHYRSKWYVLRGERPLVFGVGVFGQNVFVDIKNDLVIAKASSQPLPLDKDFGSLTLAGVQEMRRVFG